MEEVKQQTIYDDVEIGGRMMKKQSVKHYTPIVINHEALMEKLQTALEEKRTWLDRNEKYRLMLADQIYSDPRQDWDLRTVAYKTIMEILDRLETA